MALQKTALLSVTDKTGLVPFARGLHDLGWKLLSTGGTGRELKNASIPYTEVATVTNSPELFDGRVKTLHPKIHGGILFDRSKPEHVAQAQEHKIDAIDMVVVNLYLFAENAVAENKSAEDAIEHIDIGGPALLRASAKNYAHCLPVVDPADYSKVLELLRAGDLPMAQRLTFSQKVFSTVSRYDGMIAQHLGASELKDRITLGLETVQKLRYGENPHQKAVWHRLSGEPLRGFANAQVIQGKELSYNNLLDLNAAASIVHEFVDAPAVVIVKHNNPCGVASLQKSLLDLYNFALASDPQSAFGGIIACNREINASVAVEMHKIFFECIVAPDFTADALEIFRSKPNLRIIKLPLQSMKPQERWQYRSIDGGLLAQTVDNKQIDFHNWQTKTKRAPTSGELKDLQFAMRVTRHVKSNALVFAKDGATISIGAGQMSRIDSGRIAALKAEIQQKTIRSCVMASDAFFPFRDTVDFAALHGITAIAQPGGSIRDQESIDAANEANLAMVFTGMRHFSH